MLEPRTTIYVFPVEEEILKNICVVGTGYVGLVTGVCFADLGNNVTCVDVDPRKLEMLRGGKSPIYEPGLEELLERNMRAGRLSFTDSYTIGMDGADFVFITVGTPMGNDGAADSKYIRAAARSIGEAISGPVVVIDKSTVPVGTGDMVTEIIREHARADISFEVVSNPEFLREGSAVSDFFKPDRIVLGCANREAAEFVGSLHEVLGANVIITDLRTAEMIKYASNAFLATRISFINEIAQICEKLGADVKEVARGMGADKRIGPHFLGAGAGWGGSCFGKDTAALIKAACGSLAPKIAIILGSGLGGLADKVERPVVLPYRDLPGFPILTVAGHAGQLILGRLNGVDVIVFNGRKHFYETSDAYPIKTMIRAVRRAGAARAPGSAAALGHSPSRIDRSIAADREDRERGANAGAGPGKRA